jgi:hypothetical protein
MLIGTWYGGEDVLAAKSSIEAGSSDVVLTVTEPE